MYLRSVQQAYIGEVVTMAADGVETMEASFLARASVQVEHLQSYAGGRQEYVFERAESDVLDLAVSRHNTVSAVFLNCLAKQPWSIVGLMGLHPRRSERLRRY